MNCASSGEGSAGWCTAKCLSSVQSLLHSELWLAADTLNANAVSVVGSVFHFLGYVKVGKGHAAQAEAL